MYVFYKEIIQKFKIIAFLNRSENVVWTCDTASYLSGFNKASLFFDAEISF